MKKYIFIFLFVVLFACACGNTKVLECSITNPGTNMTAYANVKYTFKGDKLKSFHVKADFKDIEVENIDEYWDQVVEQFTGQNKPVKETGYVRKVSSDAKNHIFTITIDVDYDKITAESIKKYGVEDWANKSYEEIKEAVIDENTVCK